MRENKEIAPQPAGTRLTGGYATLTLPMQTGFHHAIKSHRHGKKGAKTLTDIIDKSAYLMGGITVTVNIPQLISVWTAPDTSGVSLVSWTGFLLGSCFWLLYGLLHAEKPIIAINAMLISVQALIVAGLIIR